MKILSSLILSAALVAGVTGATLAYRHTSEPAALVAVDATSSVKPRPAAQVVRPGTHFRWAACPSGSRLDKGHCVTDVVRTVVIPAPAAPVVAQPAPAAQHVAAPAPAVAADDGQAEPEQTHADDAGDDSTGQDQGDDQGDDHGDDHGDGEHDD